MSGRFLRARPLSAPHEAPDGERARSAARDLLQGGQPSIRAAARVHGVKYPAHVNYWVRKWKGTEYEEAVQRLHREEESTRVHADTANRVVSETSAAARTRTSSSSAANGTFHELQRSSATHVRKVMIAEAVAMVQEGSTLRRAADAVNQKYSSDGRGIKVSYSSVSRFKDPAYQPQSKGKQAYLPEEFDHKICDFVLALRALKWPVFKDQVVAIAVEGCLFMTLRAIMYKFIHLFQAFIRRSFDAHNRRLVLLVCQGSMSHYIPLSHQLSQTY